ncbi:MAG: FMN-binding protein [Atopobiaceae bacterium]|nr:FMN-binding protein [Atopobiaceae bacterium]
MSAKNVGSATSSLKPVVVLVAICAVAGVLLGAVHQVTAPVIAEAGARRAQETYAALVPEAASFEDLPFSTEGCMAALRAVDGSGATLGYVVVAADRGYGGAVPLAVAFDASGTVTNITVMPNEETPGLGSRITEDAYISQYVGLSAEPQDESSIDLISGATISSRAALNAFNHAVEAYEEVRS